MDLFEFLIGLASTILCYIIPDLVVLIMTRYDEIIIMGLLIYLIMKMIKKYKINHYER